MGFCDQYAQARAGQRLKQRENIGKRATVARVAASHQSAFHRNRKTEETGSRVFRAQYARATLPAPGAAT